MVLLFLFYKYGIIKSLVYMFKFVLLYFRDRFLGLGLRRYVIFQYMERKKLPQNSAAGKFELRVEFNLIQRNELM